MSAVSNVHGSMIMEVQSHALGEGEAPRLPMGGEGEALFVMQQHLASPAGQLVQRAVRMQQLQMHVFDSVFELTEASSGCSARPRTSYEGALERRRAAMERTLESVQQLFTFQREMLSDLSKAQFSLVQYQTWNPLCGHTERVFFHKCKLCTQQFSTAYGTRIADPFNRAGEQADSKDYVSISDSANELFNMIDFDACCPARICNTSSTSSESVEHGGDNKETGLRTLAATWAEDVGVFCDQSAGEQELETDIKRKLLFFEHCRELFNGLFAKETVNDVAIEVNAKEVVSELSRAVMDLPVGQSLIVPVTPKKHIAVLEIRKTGESKFSLAYFNTSPPAKSDAHVEAVKEKRDSRHDYAYPVLFENVSADTMTQLLQRVVDYNLGAQMFKNGSSKTKNFSSGKFYDILYKLAGTDSDPERTKGGRSIVPYKIQIRGSCSYDSIRSWFRQECFDHGEAGVKWYRKFMLLQLDRKCQKAKEILDEEASLAPSPRAVGDSLSSSVSDSLASYQAREQILMEAKKKLALRAKKLEVATFGSFRRVGIVPCLVSLFKKAASLLWMA